MLVSEEDVQEFQALYKKHFGRDINRAEALAKAIQLLRTVELTYKPMTEQELEKVLTLLASLN